MCLVIVCKFLTHLKGINGSSKVKVGFQRYLTFQIQSFMSKNLVQKNYTRHANLFTTGNYDKYLDIYLSHVVSINNDTREISTGN